MCEKIILLLFVFCSLLATLSCVLWKSVSYCSYNAKWQAAKKSNCNRLPHICLWRRSLISHSYRSLGFSLSQAVRPALVSFPNFNIFLAPDFLIVNFVDGFWQNRKG